MEYPSLTKYKESRQNLKQTHQNTCKILIRIANILTHLNTEDFGINITSILLDYLVCIGKQLIQALNDPSQLDKVYQGLTIYIS